MIKLLGGPNDGEVIKVSHSLNEWEVKLHYSSALNDNKTFVWIYRETEDRTVRDEVIFSCL